MKIVAGLGSVDDCVRYAKAGADEVFCGYVPFEWAKQYGSLMPLNRREVFYYNVQLGALSELKILRKLADKLNVSVKLTFNSLYYLQEQYPQIEMIMKRCMEVGFDTFIIADPALLIYLRERGLKCKFHISGEFGSDNLSMIQWLKEFDISRIIFHRKNTVEDMRKCIGAENKLEYEAFVMNEQCHFTGAYCNSLHCDELCYMCQVPYKVVYRNNFEVDKSDREVQESRNENEEDIYMPGSTGCGLCALYSLWQAGITHLKVVGRGNHSDDMEADIRSLKQAINILNEVKFTENPEQLYISKMKEQLFPKGCSKNCYYIS